jgi:hypothetical protein
MENTMNAAVEIEDEDEQHADEFKRLDDTFEDLDYYYGCASINVCLFTLLKRLDEEKSAIELDGFREIGKIPELLQEIQKTKTGRRYSEGVEIRQDSLNRIMILQKNEKGVAEKIGSIYRGEWKDGEFLETSYRKMMVECYEESAINDSASGYDW